MDGFIVAFLGPYTGAVLALSAMLVAMTRKSIRRSHIAWLLAITVITFVAFFAVLLWGFTWHDGKKSVVLYQLALRWMAATIVGCGSAIGFYFILKRLGLASPPDGRRAPGPR